MKGLLEDEAGVEPIVMKIMAGIILLAVGLGIGVALYQQAGMGAEQTLSFSVNVSPTSATIGRPTASENTITAQVTVRPVLGYDKQVTLSATGMPTGVSVSFSPQSSTPEFGSTMTISVDNNADLGTITITIRGTGEDDTEKSTTFELTIVD
ncbi:unnamed protein product [marine sediment metagenome]|uniref:Uncharacterized protein n=1 Tax=marine sediment metagenome TaxID=412755 RepID=X1L7E2_9ZZZZ